MQVVPSRGQLGHPSKIAHVDPASVHGRYQRVAVDGRECQLHAVSYQLGDDKVGEEESRLMEEGTISLQHLLRLGGEREGGGRRRRREG